MRKRAIRLGLLLVLVICLLTVSALAAEVVDSGNCGAEGDNLTWTLTDDGVLTIEGEGDMADWNNDDWNNDNDAPWYTNRAGIQSVVLAESVTSIGSSAFDGCSNLKSVTIPEGVTSIGDYTFCGCSSLSDVTIPEGVTSIERGTFYGCSSLSNVTIPEGVTSIGGYAFYGCSSLSNVTIPKGVTNIEEFTFFGCSSLRNVTIPEGVTSIEKCAFDGCSSLNSVAIPDSVSSIKYGAFMGCDGIKDVYLTDIGVWLQVSMEEYSDPFAVNRNEKNLYLNGKLVTTLVIPDSVTSIRDKAFYYCNTLISVTIPDGVTSMGKYAFWGCARLRNVTIPKGITNIRECTFYGCSSLSNVTIPEGVTSIEWGAFYGCSSLSNVTIPEGVTSIGSSAFKECSSLSDVTIPEGVTSIGDNAFSGCGGLIGVIIPDNVTCIWDGAFYDCDSLTSVTIPDSVTIIGTNAFNNCLRLSDIYYGGTESQWIALDGPAVSRVHYNCDSAQGHWTTETIPANCHTAGSSSESCECGFTRNEISIPATGEHDYRSVVTPPTCTIDGYTTYTCQRDGCKDSYVADRVAARGHDYDNGVITTQPTETTTGVKTYTCATCGITKTESIPATGSAAAPFEPSTVTNPFVDVQKSAFYYNPVMWAISNGVTSGTSATTFSPNDSCTRGQVVTFLWRAAGCPAPKTTSCPFTDVSSSGFYYKAMMWAVENGVTSGTSATTFSPNDPCTRGQVVTFLYRAAGKPAVSTNKCAFTDISSSGFYYRP